MKGQCFGDINDYRKYGLLRAPQASSAGTYGSLRVPDRRHARDARRDDLRRAASGVDLLFLDPDNGIEVPSKPAGRRGSSKYVTWAEIQALWEGGPSLLIYRHVRCEARGDAERRSSYPLDGGAGRSIPQS